MDIKHLDFLKIFMPRLPMCIICRERTPYGCGFRGEENICICNDCMEKIDKYSSPAVFKGKTDLKYYLCSFPYTGVLREAFIRYKFFGERAYAEIFSQFMIDCIKEFWHDGDFDLIVPVPLSAERMTERGYNQAALLAQRVAEALDTEYSEEVLFRIINTRRQSELSYEERSINIKDAFLARGMQLKGKSVLLVDDVYTVGATMRECAKTLREAGAAKIAGLALFKSVSPEIKNKKEYTFEKD